MLKDPNLNVKPKILSHRIVESALTPPKKIPMEYSLPTIPMEYSLSMMKKELNLIVKSNRCLPLLADFARFVQQSQVTYTP